MAYQSAREQQHRDFMAELRARLCAGIDIDDIDRYPASGWVGSEVAQHLLA